VSKSIGVCECVTKGCIEQAEIREMRGTVKGAAGRLYLFCPSCGVVRSSGPKMQEYIKQHGDFTEELDFCQDPVKDPAPKPAKPETNEKSDIWAGW
jgi:hypothetical protein